MFSGGVIRLYSKKGQIFPLLITITVILTIAALISANLGKVSLDRLSCINAAEAGALAGVSDFICGYNKGRWAHIAMLITWGGIQAYLTWPQFIWCYPYRAWWATIAKSLNQRLYFGIRPIVRGYSESARIDAYNFAFDNAGIDDKYRVDAGQYRDKPHPDEDWPHWTSLRSAFSEWQLGLRQGWAAQGSWTYNWHNGSKWIRVSCSSSPPQELGSRRIPLIGLYMLPPPYSFIIIPLWHGNIYAWLQNPSTRFVTMSVERGHQPAEQDLGFWSVRHPNTNSSSTSTMRGGFTTGFHF
jgi:hypothetical protein